MWEVEGQGSGLRGGMRLWGKDQEWGGVLWGDVSSALYFRRTLSRSGGGMEEKVERV